MSLQILAVMAPASGGWGVFPRPLSTMAQLQLLLLCPLAPALCPCRVCVCVCVCVLVSSHSLCWEEGDSQPGAVGCSALCGLQGRCAGGWSTLSTNFCRRSHQAGVCVGRSGWLQLYSQNCLFKTRSLRSLASKSHIRAWRDHSESIICIKVL